MENNRSFIKNDTPTAPKRLLTEREIRYELPFDAGLESLLYIGEVCRADWSVSGHYHEHFELCCVCEGSGWFAIDDVFYEAHEGDLFITKPGERHWGGALAGQPFRLYYVGFRLTHMRSLELELYRLGMQRVGRDTGRVTIRYFNDILDEIQNSRKHRQDMVQGLLLQLLVAVVRIYAENRAGPVEDVERHDGLNPMMTRVLDYVHSRLRYDLRAEEIAQAAHVSRSHLAREFKQRLGQSVGEYIRSLCIDKAKISLRETSDSIQSISEKLNFSSIHSFSIYFKRHTGYAPQEYRKHTAGVRPRTKERPNDTIV
ncbi:helix-turn-helix domain-containing protein [Paenibacillus thermotolerans]|uniref:helix-turn-helix domain-containing protein n=1 Tax=Paenibacillus thermotolerans TaxID=3027807 RepID=UPI0023676EA0|nr:MULTISPECIES: AraC family transcriptional regulator [unclassified Paenibacillus]